MAGKKITFVLSDDSLNAYGFRILTAGLDLSQFEKNPIMLYAHIRAYDHHGKEKPVLPIGMWENIRKDGSRVLADGVFDEDDEFAMQVASKIEKRMLNTASIGVDPVEWSEDPEDMVPGQTLPTITKGVVKEASIADIPGNHNALRLSHEGVTVRLGLSDSNPDDLAKIFQTNKTDDMKELIMLLNKSFGFNLSLTSKEEEVAEAVRKNLETLEADTKTLKDQVATLTTEKADLEKKLTDQTAAAHQAKVKALIDPAVEAKKITQKEGESYAKLAATEEGFEAVKDLLKEKKAYTPASTLIANGAASAAADEQLNDTDLAAEWDKLISENKLQQLKDKDIDRFKLLFKAKYGREYTQ